MASCRLALIAALFLLYCGAHAQTAPGIYKVTFTDKNNTPFSINQPLDYLSQRAIDRRNRHPPRCR